MRLLGQSLQVRLSQRLPVEQGRQVSDLFPLHVLHLCQLLLGRRHSYPRDRVKDARYMHLESGWRLRRWTSSLQMRGRTLQ